MRKYYITRRSAVTVCTVKAVNKHTYEVVDITTAVDGGFPSKSDALKAVNKVWENEDFQPIAVVDMTFHIQTRGMTVAAWFENADFVSDDEVSAEEVAQFGKRAKKSDEQ